LVDAAGDADHLRVLVGRQQGLEQAWLEGAIVVQEHHYVAARRVDADIALQSGSGIAGHVAHRHAGKAGPQRARDALRGALGITVDDDHLAVARQPPPGALEHSGQRLGPALGRDDHRAAHGREA